MNVLLENIPQELILTPNWVVWRYEQRDGDKPTKVPYRPDGRHAKSNDPGTWSPFAQVMGLEGFDGIGWVFDGHGIVGVDLDNSIGDDGKLKPWALALVRRCNTYTEISPSGKGVKLWLRGTWPNGASGKRVQYHDGAVEMYHSHRYFTVTGRIVEGGNPAIETRQDCIDGIYRKILSQVIGPTRQTQQDAPGSSAVSRCMKYLEQCPDAVSGQCGHDKTLRAACECFRFGLSESEARGVLDWYSATKSQPQWSAKEIEHKIRDAFVKVRDSGEFGCRLRDDRPKRRIEIPPPPTEPSKFLQCANERVEGLCKNIPWPWPLLTQIGQCLIAGTVTVLCGIGGASKSLLVSEAMIHWIRAGVPVAVYHLEEDREFHQFRVLAQAGEESQVTEPDWAHEHPDEFFALLDAHIDIVNEAGRRIWDAPDTLIDYPTVTQWIADRCAGGCRIIVVDPITAVDSGNAPWQADQRFLADVKPILRKHGASLIVVTHPRGGAHKDGSYLDSLAGGRAWSRFSQSVLWLSMRDDRKPVTVTQWTAHGTIREPMDPNRILHVVKARSGRGSGMKLAYQFDQRSLCFRELGALT